MAEDSHTVRLSFKNYEFEVTVDLDTYRKINTDSTYKEDFARQTYESLENDGHFMAEEQQVESEDIKPPTLSLFKWTKPAIDQLINIRFSRNDEFNSPKTRKSELWQSVARQLSLHFPGVTGEMCDAKYRNLLHTFKLNKQKESRYGVESIKWEYFEQFDTNLGLSIKLPLKDTDCFDSIFEKDSEPDTEFKKQDLIGLDSPPGSPTSCPVKRKCSDLSIPQYLRLKAENDIRNMKLKAKIWKEKKQLKEREIAAILQLAKALKSKK